MGCSRRRPRLFSHKHRRPRPKRPLLAAALVACLAGAAQAEVIGPDAFGYRATDELNVPDLDPTADGVRVLESADDAAVGVNFGFDFSFYGSTYNRLDISSNGLVTLGPGPANTSFQNLDLTTQTPSPDGPTIAVLWDDWYFDDAAGDGVYFDLLGAPGSRRLVVQWTNARPVGDAGEPEETVTFQLRLVEEDSLIVMHYLDVGTLEPGDAGGSATVGIRAAGDPADGNVLQWSFNEAVLSDGQTILFHDGRTGGVIPEPASLALLGLGVAGAACRRRRIDKG